MDFLARDDIQRLDLSWHLLVIYLGFRQNPLDSSFMTEVGYCCSLINRLVNFHGIGTVEKKAQRRSWQAPGKQDVGGR
jgi:hypothetical protein